MTQYLKITIDAPASLEEELTMLLFDYGVSGVAVDDPAAIKAHLEAGHWDASVFDVSELRIGRITLSSVLAADALGEKAASALAADLEKRSEVIFTRESLPQVDWLMKWKEAFSPRAIGEVLWIRPCWDKTPVPKGRIPVAIEPGMAFGTGDHATTAMMLELTEKHLQPGLRILDLGCGSGILGIAALKLGARAASGVDIDPLCADVAAKQCLINDIPKGDFCFYLGDILDDDILHQRFSACKSGLVLANINVDCVCRLSGMVSDFMDTGGLFLSSGVLKQDDARAVMAFQKAGLTVVERREADGWLAYAVRRGDV